MSIIRKFFKIKNNFFRKFFISKVLKKYFSYRYLVYYNKKNDSVLSKLSNNLSTDKGYTLDKLKNENLDAKQYHDYLDFYSDLFNLSRDYIKKVFELGIGSVDSNQMYNMLHIGKTTHQEARFDYGRNISRAQQSRVLILIKKHYFQRKE